MRINADLTKRMVVDTENMDWRASPMAGVSRRMLDRLDAESGRATSIVKYDARSYFSPHTHTGGEEVFVIEGVFSDEHGDYPKGTWLRNPHMSSHSPFSNEGCLIYLKTGHLPIGKT